MGEHPVIALLGHPYFFLLRFLRLIKYLNAVFAMAFVSAGSGIGGNPTPAMPGVVMTMAMMSITMPLRPQPIIWRAA